MKKYKHKPTGWIYHTEPAFPCELVSESGNRIPESLAVFGENHDWEEIMPVITIDGVDFYHGDKFYYAYKDGTTYYDRTANKYSKWTVEENVILFPNRAAAQKYIDRPYYPKRLVDDFFESHGWDNWRYQDLVDKIRDYTL